LEINGILAGVFGSNPSEKFAFEESVAKKSEIEGIRIYSRTDAGRRLSLLDDTQFPDKIQGYARIASISDHAFFIYPSQDKIGTADGELALLIDSLELQGSVVSFNPQVDQSTIRSTFKGLNVANFQVDVRNKKSSLIELSTIKVPTRFPSEKTLIYLDRAFNVKGVGLVVLGFILCGSINLHDRIRLIPSVPPKYAEVKGIQLNDVDEQSAGRGLRIGLSLKGVELKDLEKTTWLDDSTFQLEDTLRSNFRSCKFYKQSIVGRDLHVQVAGQLLPAKISGEENGTIQTKLPYAVPVWDKMKTCVIDLNAKKLRIAGGADLIS
jgi:selenocysteine-specific translation elongation factor